MAHSLVPSPASLTLISARGANKQNPLQILKFERQCGGYHGSDQAQNCKSATQLVDRRALVCGAMLVGLFSGGDGANAAARKPPPPPPTEKKDPNVSGVQAKILASKKRKEAMEQEMAKLRAKGKPITPPAQ